MIAPPKKPLQKKGINFLSITLWTVIISLIGIIIFSFYGGANINVDNVQTKTEKKIKNVAKKSIKSHTKIHSIKKVNTNKEYIVENPKTNQWGNPLHWGHKKLRPAMVHRIDRSQMPLFEQIFLNSADKTIAGLLVIEPGTDLIGDEIFDDAFIKAFLKSIESPIIISKEDTEEAKALKRAVIETKIDLKARLDEGEDIAKTLTDIRRELRELGAYREEIKKLIDEKSRDHNLNIDDMKDFVKAANIMLEERGAKSIVMPEFYYRQLEIRNQKIKEIKGE